MAVPSSRDRVEYAVCSGAMLQRAHCIVFLGVSMFVHGACADRMKTVPQGGLCSGTPRASDIHA